jgi:UDP-N-acetylmuramate--alanine ligase
MSPDPRAPDLATVRRIHLVGIGGAGMSGIARILAQRGHDVRGSDLRDGPSVLALRGLGVRVAIGHDADLVSDAELVVVSAAVRADNPELAAARAQGIPVLARAEMLAALMTGDRRVLVAGTHGKTTTTSMVVVGLQAAGHDPTFAIGGELNEAGTNAHAGVDPVFVAEADESDRSFLAYAPDVAVVTNVELDHPEAYDGLADVVTAFAAFASRRRPGGTLVAGLDDPGVRDLLAVADGPVVTFGTDPAADVRVLPPRGSGPAVIRIDGERLPVRLAVPGRHNLLNAAAALAAVRAVGGEPASALAGIAGFRGAARRFQVLGEVAGITVVDDYAHHPTELRATLAAAREAAPRRRLVCVVQPHRHSRTAVLGTDLGRAAAGADLVIVTDVYGAGETPVPGVTGALVAEAARAAGARVVYAPHLGEVPALLAAEVVAGDLVLVAGAGDVGQVGPALLARLRDA